MKKIFASLVLLSIFQINAQEQHLTNGASKSKFQIGIQFNPLIKNDYLYNGLVGINLRYNVLTIDKIHFNLGFNAHLLHSKAQEFSNPMIWNPNGTIEFHVFKFRMCPYLGIGYVFYNSKFETRDFLIPDQPDPAFTTEATIRYQGYNINSGFRYYLKKIFFVDANYNFMAFKSSEGTKNKFHLIGIGAGVQF